MLWDCLWYHVSMVYSFKVLFECSIVSFFLYIHNSVYITFSMLLITFTFLFKLFIAKHTTNLYWFVMVFGHVIINYTVFYVSKRFIILSLTLRADFFTDLGIWLINQSYQSYHVLIANDAYFAIYIFSNSFMLIGEGTDLIPGPNVGVVTAGVTSRSSDYTLDILWYPSIFLSLASIFNLAIVRLEIHLYKEIFIIFNSSKFLGIFLFYPNHLFFNPFWTFHVSNRGALEWCIMDRLWLLVYCQKLRIKRDLSMIIIDPSETVFDILDHFFDSWSVINGSF